MSVRGRQTAPHDAVRIDLDVPLYDVDPLHVVWHGNYFKYLDAARSALFRSRGLDIGDLTDLSLRMMIVDAGCRYAYPLRYGDRARVSAWIASIDNRIRVAYEIWNVTHGRSSASAHTLLVTTDPDGKLLWQTPAVVRERLLPNTRS